MSTAAPVTQRDLARACGVHPSTICLALNNAPSIPAVTRQRIQAAARRLGYRPNAAARNLAFLRSERSVGASLPMAWISQEPERDFWRRDPGARDYREGAARRAASLGYHLEEFWVHEPGMTPGRLARILRARGIACALFPIYRTFDPDLLQPVWSGFSCAAFNDHRADAWLDVVSPDYYHNTALALDRLQEQGYGRIGLVITEAFDQATDGLVRSRYLRHQDEIPPVRRLPACVLRGGPESLAAWAGLHAPDALLCDDVALAARIEAAGLTAAAVPLRQAGDASGRAGIDERAAEIAATAVGCLADKAKRFERGIGGSTRQYLIKGAWHEPVAPAMPLADCGLAGGLLATAV